MTFADDLDAITAAELRARGSLKWTRPGPDGLGAFVAEMDFGAAVPILDALAELSRTAGFGYLSEPKADELARACADWQQSRYGWAVPAAWIRPLADVVRALELTISYFSRSRAPVVLPTPAYMPFLLVPGLLGREVIQVPMHNDRGYFTHDLDALDAAFRAGGDLLVFCNPLNPVGRVFERDEMLAIADVVDRHGGRVFSDEIHAPLVYPGKTHLPYASLSEATAGHTVTATSASKGWNLAGLKCAQIIFSNEADRARWETVGHFAEHGASTPGVAANTAAYRAGAAWLDDVIGYLAGSRALLASLLAQELPEVVFRPPEATYLAWLDFRPLELPVSPAELFGEKAGVVVVDGAECGEGGPGSLRLNFATPRPILAEMVHRMGAAVRSA